MLSCMIDLLSRSVSLPAAARSRPRCPSPRGTWRPCAAPPECPRRRGARRCARQSEEHTSELQSRRDLVCRLLLEKKKNKKFKIAECQCYRYAPSYVSTTYHIL